jgi:hypothetical protein
MFICCFPVEMLLVMLSGGTAQLLILYAQEYLTLREVDRHGMTLLQ